jgi:hypothetical protein
MRGRIRRRLGPAARAALTWLVLELEDLGLALVRLIGARRRRAPPPEPEGSRVARPPVGGDERTARRLAEAEHGGLSSAESAARWERGENPGGTHHKAVRHDGPEHPRPSQEEPQERKERVPHGENHLPVTRRGM